MTKRRWVALVVVIVSVQLALGFNAFGVKRVGAMYPVQGVFVAACEDTNEVAGSGDCKFTHSAHQWKAIPGASYAFEISAEEVQSAQALIWARFAGQTRCTGGPGQCVVRIRVTLPNGTTIAMKPNPAPAGIGLYFEGTSSDAFEAHAVEQVYYPNVGAGRYTVFVEAAVQPNSGAQNPTFRFAAWSLATEVAYTKYV